MVERSQNVHFYFPAFHYYSYLFQGGGLLFLPVLVSMFYVAIFDTVKLILNWRGLNSLTQNRQQDIISLLQEWFHKIYTIKKKFLNFLSGNKPQQVCLRSIAQERALSPVPFLWVHVTQHSEGALSIARPKLNLFFLSVTFAVCE